MQNNFPFKSSEILFFSIPPLLHPNAKDVCLAQVDLKILFRIFFISKILFNQSAWAQYLRTNSHAFFPDDFFTSVHLFLRFYWDQKLIKNIYFIILVAVEVNGALSVYVMNQFNLAVDFSFNLIFKQSTSWLRHTFARCSSVGTSGNFSLDSLRR